MALQASGAISLADIQTEFGGSNPIGINEYYGVAAGVPASGTISLNNFYGKSYLIPISWSGNPPTLGRSETQSDLNSTASFTGNTVTPGAESKFNISINTSGGGEISLRFYVSGSLNTTWTTITNLTPAQFTTSGSSPIRFDSTITDGSAYYASGYATPLPLVVIYAQFTSVNDLGPGAYIHSHDWNAYGNRD